MEAVPVENPDEGVIRVSATVDPNALASVVARAVYSGDYKNTRLRAIGAGPVNQATKACAIASTYAAARGLSLSYRIGFEDVIGDSGKKISAMIWRMVVD